MCCNTLLHKRQSIGILVAFLERLHSWYFTPNDSVRYFWWISTCIYTKVPCSYIWVEKITHSSVTQLFNTSHKQRGGGGRDLHNLKKKDRKKRVVPWHFVLQVHFSLVVSALPIYWKHLHVNTHTNLYQCENNISKANVQENCTLYQTHCILNNFFP